MDSLAIEQTGSAAFDAVEQHDSVGDIPQSLADFLRAREIISAESLVRATMVQQRSGEPLHSVITRLGVISEDRLASAFAEAQKLDIVEAGDFPTERVQGADLSAEFLRDVHAVPIETRAGRLLIAVANPLDETAARTLGFAFGLKGHYAVARATDIAAAIDRLYGATIDPEAPDALADEDDLDRLKDIVSDAPVIRAVNRLVALAVDERASDIHLEPTDDSLSVRMRIDGRLRAETPLPAAMRAPLVSRIKVMAGLNIAERRIPQDGRMRVAVRGQEIDFRVATAPSIHGESVVLRILDRSKLALEFGALGFDEPLADALRQALHRPYGIVLVTGPTGSGKTTTLYAALSELNSDDRKLLTVEDPIEYRLPGIVQTQVNPGIGFTFGSALRSFLRQDPDVMMVGEIRDGETAQIAVQAALTGHMILSTLHTNTAAGAVTRLLDMGVEPFLLSSVLTGVLAQRLVRRLCPSCREPFVAPVAVVAPLGLQSATTLYRARGCAACRDTGYAGRIALIEFLTVDPAIERLILERADSRAIAAAASQAGMRTMIADGVAKAREGATTIEEVLRVTVED